MLISDIRLKELDDEKMITPFIDKSVKEVDGTKVMSYGLSSYGYDIRMADDLLILANKTLSAEYVDPKLGGADVRTTQAIDNIIPANCGALTHSVEHFDMPDNVMAICVGKSTYARSGLIVNVTPLEAGWSGQLTIELINTNPYPLKVYPGEGIAQLLFFEGYSCENPYHKRSGKYQGQTGVTQGRM